MAEDKITMICGCEPDCYQMGLDGEEHICCSKHLTYRLMPVVTREDIEKHRALNNKFIKGENK